MLLSGWIFAFFLDQQKRELRSKKTGRRRINSAVRVELGKAKDSPKGVARAKFYEGRFWSSGRNWGGVHTVRKERFGEHGFFGPSEKNSDLASRSARNLNRDALTLLNESIKG